MNETIILVMLIAAFFAITVFSLVAMLILRHKEKNREYVKNIDKAIADLDAALDTAVNEINKLGVIVQNELDEKYKAMLFLYNLVEDKQKEMAESADSNVVSEMLANYLETHGSAIQLMDGAPSEDVNAVAAIGDGNNAVGIAVAQTDVFIGESEGNINNIGDMGDSPSLVVKKHPRFVNPVHKRIWEMREQGRSLPDIAKDLGMGQGEVKLILDLADRAS